MKQRVKKILDRVFNLTIFIKGVDGILDMAAALTILVMGSDAITSITTLLVREELLEDPQDFVANYLLEASQNLLPDTQSFIILYLSIHGLIKIAIALAIYSKNHRLHKIAEVVLGVFIVYQLYRFGHTHSLTLLALTLVDVMIIILMHLKSKPRLLKEVNL